MYDLMTDDELLRYIDIERTRVSDWAGTRRASRSEENIRDMQYEIQCRDRDANMWQDPAEAEQMRGVYPRLSSEHAFCIAFSPCRTCGQHVATCQCYIDCEAEIQAIVDADTMVECDWCEVEVDHDRVAQVPVYLGRYDDAAGTRWYVIMFEGEGKLRTNVLPKRYYCTRGEARAYAALVARGGVR